MKKLEIVGFSNRSGYSQATHDYICALQDHGYHINFMTLHPNVDPVSLTKDMYNRICSIVNKTRDTESVQLLQCIPDMQLKVPKYKYNIGFGIFETFDPPPHWIQILNLNTAVICPSLFNYNMFKKHGVTKPIYHIPHCLDMNLYNPNLVVEKKYDEFVFLFIGTWKKRKGWPQLIEAFLREFSSKDKVRLVIKSDRVMYAQRDIEEIQKTIKGKDFAPISFETRILTEVEIAQLIKSSDCFVMPTLGEGFGLGGLQSLCLGVPLIVTDFSGPQDYANEENATLIKPNGFIVTGDMDKIPQFESKPFANVSVQSVQDAMRDVLSNYAVKKEKTMKNIDTLRNNYSYKVTAERFDRMLEEICH
jgi:glycosyltransferase involved in cell wall biosynthesis